MLLSVGESVDMEAMDSDADELPPEYFFSQRPPGCEVSPPRPVQVTAASPATPAKLSANRGEELSPDHVCFGLCNRAGYLIPFLLVLNFPLR